MTGRRLGGEEGAGLIEWALAVVLIAVVALGAVGFVGDQVSGIWGDAGTALSGDSQVQVTKPGPPGLCKQGNAVGSSGNQPPPVQRCP